MTDRFSLLRLPLLAIQGVVNHLNPHEIIALTQISSKAKDIVKYRSMLSKNDIVLSIGKGFIVLILSHLGYYMFRFTSNPEEDGVTKDIKDDDGRIFHEIAIHAVDLFGECREFFKFAKECMNARFFGLRFDLNENLDKHTEILTWLNSHSPDRKRFDLCLEGTTVSPKEANYFLEHFKMSTLGVEFDTENNSPIQVPKELQLLLLIKANWVTLDHLMNFDAAEIQIQEHKLTLQELNMFLRKVQNQECCRNLKRFGIQINTQQNFDNILRGIKGEQYLHFGRYAFITIRADGKRAVFYRKRCLEKLFFEMEVLDE